MHSELVRDTLLELSQQLYNEYSETLTYVISFIHLITVNARFYIHWNRKPFDTNETLQIGDYCACPSESEDWYRGLIRQIDPTGHAFVFKIDYGDVQCIHKQFLRPLQVKIFVFFVKIYILLIRNI